MTLTQHALTLCFKLHKTRIADHLNLLRQVFNSLPCCITGQKTLLSKLLFTHLQVLAASDAPVGLLSPSLPPLTPSIEHLNLLSTAVDKDNTKHPEDFLDPTRMHTPTYLPPDDDSDKSSSSSLESFFIPASKMSVSGPAECPHAEPKCIPLLTPGMVLLMVMCQWEMACIDFLRENKKIHVNECIVAVLSGLKDMQA